jgi:hypothetical protein
MTVRPKRRKHAPLSAEARAWEIEQLRALGLEDVEWDPEVECPWCRQGLPHEGSEPPHPTADEPSEHDAGDGAKQGGKP